MPKFYGKDEHCAISDFTWSKSILQSETEKLGRILKQDMSLEIATLDEQASKFYKASYFNPIRLAPLVKETDVEQLIIG